MTSPRKKYPPRKRPAATDPRRFGESVPLEVRKLLDTLYNDLGFNDADRVRAWIGKARQLADPKPQVQVRGQEAFFISTPIISFPDRLRILFHGRMVVAAEINTAKPALTELTFAVPTVAGVINTSRPRSLSFTNFAAKAV